MMFMAGFIGASFIWWLAWTVAAYYLEMRITYLGFVRHKNVRHIRKDLRIARYEIRQILTLGGRLVAPGPSTSAIDRVGVVGMLIIIFLIGYAILVNKYWDTLFNGF